MATRPMSTCLEKYGDKVPVRENEWDNRHFWRVSNAEHLAMTDDCGIVNLSHFHMVDIEGPDHVELLEWLCAAKIGGDGNIGKGIYTHFLDDEGMVRADFTVIRMADRCRLINGADAGPRDFHYMKRIAEDRGLDVTITDVTEKFITIGIWGPNARDTLKKVVADPAGPRSRKTSPSPRSSRSRSAASPSPPSASPMSASRAGSCT
jgi:glycine cleavage system aminomethyltransferase T